MSSITSVYHLLESSSAFHFSQPKPLLSRSSVSFHLYVLSLTSSAHSSPPPFFLSPSQVGDHLRLAAGKLIWVIFESTGVSIATQC